VREGIFGIIAQLPVHQKRAWRNMALLQALLPRQDRLLTDPDIPDEK
jgi:hypothetical protein